MLNKKNLMFIFVSLIIISLSVSAVVAADDTNSTTVSTDDSTQLQSNDNVAYDNEVTNEKTIEKKDNNIAVKTAKTYYVSTNGKSTNTGSENSPYDLSTGFSQIQKDVGGNLIINGGTYKISSPLRLNTAGTYTITGKSGNTVIFDGQSKTRIMAIGTNVNVEIKNIVFQNGKATDWGNNGGALYIDPEGTKVITNNTFINNNGNYGGAIYAKTNNLKITNNIFTKNTASSSGAAINNLGNSTIISSNTFNQNTATKQGGAINNNGHKTQYTDNKFTSNTAESGAAINNYNANNAVISGNTFTKNSAKNSGAIYTNGNSTTITNNIFDENSATNEVAGAIYATYGSKNIISNNTFNKNSAKKNGGAITVNYVNNLEISKNKFNSNTAGVDGAAICTYGTSNIQITDNEFSKNTASQTGGALFTQASSVTFSNNKVTGNIAYRTGGAVYDEGTGIKLLNNEFSDNIVYKKSGSNIADGAAAYIRGSKATVQGNTFTNNKADGSAGAIYLDTGGYATVSQNVFNSNKAGANGGAIFARGTSNTITNNTFIKNTCSAPAPAIKNYGTGTTISGNVNDTTSAYNGTVYIAGNGNKISITKNIFQDTTPVQKVATVVTVNQVNGVVGDSITFTANVKDINGKAVTGGNIVFKLNGKTLKTDGTFDSSADANKISVSNGVAKFTVTATKDIRGAKNISASYSGSNNYLANSTKGITTAEIKLRNAAISVSASPSTQKHYETIVFTAKVSDVTKNTKSSTPSNNDESYVYFKVNGVTLKDANGKQVKAKVNNGVATYNYVVPAGMSAITKDNKIRYYNVTAGFVSPDYYPNTKAETKFNVLRSNVTITTTKVVANMSSHKLQITGNIKDSKNNNVIGVNKLGVKINGKTMSIKGSNTVNITDGKITLTIDIPSSVQNIHNITLVTGARTAYEGYRTTISSITRV